MAVLSFPLSIANFFGLLPISQISFDTPEQVVVNRTAGGEILDADVGPMLWTGTVALGRLTRSEAASPDVLLDVLRPAGRTFYAYDTRRPGPLLDTSGTILGAAVPLIASVPSARELSLSGLPVGYQLSRGDYLAFDYGSPARRALHRLVGSATANGSGVTPAFEITPMLRPGATVGATVTLVKAACRARLVPGQTSKGQSRSVITEGITFQFIQSLGG
ncbi:hypothetical protein [Tabrizicola fusiformis]|uniref:hypothetical protein n=1 Tax=Tabrizicola sp. SY72 TaxID=2741673 RepID=UPI001573E11C|nr:hypothetical protein [Tabrizicola sp. SY72]NTT86926.1 hypothetical protein [Tabrizicola sp. SY72]